jgi:uncharacterized protein with HEPN domain
MKKDPTAYLMHIRDCCIQVLACAELRNRPDVPDSILLDAICRNIEVIGEAANKLGAEGQSSYPQVPWRKMVSARNILIHNYDGVDPAIVWKIADTDIPSLLAEIRLILGD